MNNKRIFGVVLAVICAFAASSLWYSPVLFGRQFFELSGVAASSQPAFGKIAGEIVRSAILASAIFWLLARLQFSRFRSVIVFAAVLWIGFPVILLTGSVLWQNVPPELALIHSGDWLVKILLMTTLPWLVIRSAEAPGDLLKKRN